MQLPRVPASRVRLALHGVLEERLLADPTQPGDVVSTYADVEMDTTSAAFRLRREMVVSLHVPARAG